MLVVGSEGRHDATISNLHYVPAVFYIERPRTGRIGLDSGVVYTWESLSRARPIRIRVSGAAAVFSNQKIYLFSKAAEFVWVSAHHEGR